MMQLRDYQREAVDAVFREYAAGVNKQLINLATGLGKTVILGTAANELPGRLACAGRVLWLTHEESLIEQSAVSVLCTMHPDYAKKIREVLHGEEGVIRFMHLSKMQTSLHDQKANRDLQTEQLIRNNLGIIKQQLFNIQPRLVVASVQTIYNRLDRIPKDWFDLVVCDEAHLFMSRTFQETTKYFTPKILIGATATDERLDGLSLGDLFDKKIIERDLKWGIENGYLCEMEAVLLQTNVDLTSVKKTAGEFNQRELNEVIDTPVRNIKIVRKWEEVAKGRPTIAYCCTVEHAMNLSEQFNDLGISSTFVVADEKVCPDRKKRLNDFRAGKYQVMTNVMILTAGYDYPDVGCVITAAPTMSKTKFMQQIGRGSRLKSEAFRERFGKNNCIILDITDNSKKHALVNTETLDKGKRWEDKIFIGKERKAELIAIRDARKLTHVQEKDETFNLLALPKLAVRMDAPWMKEPATEGQLKWIARLGYDIVNNNFTKGQCAQIINDQECTATQMKFLQDNGYDVSMGATRENFEAAQRDVLVRNTTKYFNDKNGKKNPFAGIS